MLFFLYFCTDFQQRPHLHPTAPSWRNCAELAKDGAQDSTWGRGPLCTLMRSSNLVIVGRDPTPRRRLDENKPEERRSLILAALEASGATIEHADPAEGSAALELAVTLGVVSASRLDFLRTAHALWRAAPSPEPSFASPETAEQAGLPHFLANTNPNPDRNLVRLARDCGAGRPRAQLPRSP